MLATSWRTIRILVPVVLILMVLMRLVWMQLRDYPAYADYRALVTQTRLVDAFAERCALVEGRRDSFLLKEFNDAKDVQKNPGYDWFLSPGYLLNARSACQDGEYRPDNLVRRNQWLLVSIVALGSLLVRMLTRSWTFALVGAVVLLSRGHLLSLIGDVGPWAIITLLVLAWITATVHFFLTGSPLSVIFSLIIVMCGCVIDPMFWFLGLTLPLLLLGGIVMRRYLTVPVMQRFRAEQRRLKRLIRRGKLKVYDGSVLSGLALDLVDGLVGIRDKEQERPYARALGRTSGWLFRTLREPFALWVAQKRRWLKISAVLLPATIFIGFATFVLQHYGFGDPEMSIQWFMAPSELSLLWLNTFLDDVSVLLDWHLGLSILLIVICALQSPASGLRGFFEASWLVLVAYVLATIGAVTYDYIDFQVVQSLESSFGVWSMMAWSRSPQVLLWFEPVFLVMGLAAVYNLLVIVNQRWSKRRLQTQ